MNDAQIVAKVIAERVSIRKYTDQPIARELLEQILIAGGRAPSGENAQPWKFIVVENEEKRKKIGKLAQRGSGRRFTGQYVTGELDARFATLQDPEKRKVVYKKLTSGSVSAFLAEAPVLIIVAGYKMVWDTPYDCSAAIENMHLMAHALGLGFCWVNAVTMDTRDEKKLKDMLAIPEHYKPVAILSVGYSPTEIKPRKRLPLEEIVFYESGKDIPPGGDVH